MKNFIPILFVFTFFFRLSSQCPDTPNSIVNDPGIDNPLANSIRYMHVQCAWDIMTPGLSPVDVAVVDVFSSGLHEDLTGKISFIDQLVPMDAEWIECHHGISVAGTIAAKSNNGIAVAGVGWDTNVALYNVASSCDGGGELPVS